MSHFGQHPQFARVIDVPHPFQKLLDSSQFSAFVFLQDDDPESPGSEILLIGPSRLNCCPSLSRFQVRSIGRVDNTTVVDCRLQFVAVDRGHGSRVVVKEDTYQQRGCITEGRVTLSGVKTSY